MDPIQTPPIQLEPQEPSLNKILKISLIVLIIVTIGLGGFIYLSISQKKTSISPPVDTKKNLVITPSVVESSNPSDINIGSVEADLKDIGTDVNSLK